MNTFETSATVEEQGRVVLAGVPFAPGTEVEVSISPKAAVRKDETSADDQAWAEARSRMRVVFGRIKGFRNSPRIPREELYERGPDSNRASWRLA
jgi:hypothetical protein